VVPESFECVCALGGLPGAAGSVANAINDAGQSVGYSLGGVGGSNRYATEWSGGEVIHLAGLPGDSSFSYANAIKRWQRHQPGGLPGFTFSLAYGVNNAGQVVGQSNVNGLPYATEWSGDSIINLGVLPGYTYSSAFAVNNSGQAVGESVLVDSAAPLGIFSATEWSNGTSLT
jgi:probable HAF family extracellular repeat protein